MTEFVDLWDECECRPATFKVPNGHGGFDYVHACTCPSDPSSGGVR